MNSLAAEIVAFANSGGGRIFIGVTDKGTIREHDPASVGRLNQLIANAASNSVRPRSIRLPRMYLWVLAL